MGLLTDAGLDSGAYRNRLLSSTNGLQYWDETVGRRQFAWDTVNNRWQLVYGDTGWRDVTASLNAIASVTYGYCYIRRIGAVVHVHARVTSTVATALASMYTTPTGFRFRNGVADYGFTAFTATGAAGGRFVSAAGVDIYAQTFAAVTSLTLLFQYPTDDAWPATLPGTAVGTIPFA
jgi:hypothetical protein